MWLKLKPAVPRHWLFVLSGLMWSGVGIALCHLAYGWLKPIAHQWAMALGLLGCGAALIVYRFGFSKIARKNIRRISLMAERCCVFAFQEWKGYLIIGIMVPLGIGLRHSSLPKHYLAVIYTTIGGALLLSSLHYYVYLLREFALDKQRPSD